MSDGGYNLDETTRVAGPAEIEAMVRASMKTEEKVGAVRDIDGDLVNCLVAEARKALADLQTKGLDVTVTVPTDVLLIGGRTFTFHVTIPKEGPAA